MNRSQEDLLTYLFNTGEHLLCAPFAAWLVASPRFAAFARQYRDKIRKKIRTAEDGERLNDLRAELSVADLLLRDRRVELEYEPLQATKKRSPDFLARFRVNTICFIEVTRLRGVPSPPGGDEVSQKLAAVLCDKCGQLQANQINLLVVAAVAPGYSVSRIAATLRFLKQRADAKDEVFFVQRGVASAKLFLNQIDALSAVLVCTSEQATLWANPNARRPLPAAFDSLLAGWRF
jgi:hypothetical protein